MDGDSSDEERERPNPRQPPMSPINGTASFPSFHSQQFGINLAAHEAISPSLRELCAAHGVQPHDAHLLLSKIDLFQPVDFSLQTLTTFSKLVEVTVIQAPRVTSLAGLSACRNLKKLFVVECSLTSLAGLEELTSLTHLCLDGNSISRIRNECFIGCGHSLQILSLNENRIPRIEGLWRCTRLKELSLARNFISAIGEERSISDGIVNSLSNESSLSIKRRRYFFFVAFTWI
jgi:Leucine-rich repeat (LRR) protein